MKISPVNFANYKTYKPLLQKPLQTKVNSKFELSNVQKPIFLGRYTSSVCLIFEDDSVEKFDSCEQAAQRLGVTKEEVFNYLRTNSKTRLNGALCVYSDIIETKKPSGEIVFDENKIAQLKTRTKKRQSQSIESDNKKDMKYKKAVYQVSLDGSIEMFKSKKEASRETGVAYPNIAAIMNKEKAYKATREYKTFISVYDASIKDKSGNLIFDENGKPILDENVILELRKMLSGLPMPQIVAIDKDYNVEIFQSRQEVTEKEQVNSTALSWNIICFARELNGKTYAKLNEVVLRDDNGLMLFDENGDFVLDMAKIKKLHDTAGL